MTTASGDAQPGGSGSIGPTTFAGRWALDGERTTVRFRSTSLWGLIKVKGRFATVRGEAQVDPQGTALTGRLVLDVASIDTGKSKRDTHLRSGDFFDAATHPEVTYEVTEFRPAGEDLARLIGTLSIAGRARPLELNAMTTDRDDDSVTVVAATTIDRSQWGIGWKKMGMTKMATPIEISARFVRVP